MIIKILSASKSFKGLGTYLTHDPGAQTSERVGWTHTHNLAHDHVPSAIDEMLWTSRNAELLKQEAGIRAGGRATENTVKHVSLNWSPEENPSKEHMISASEDFLRAMKWDEHQALLIAHEDKAHRHVHIMLNTVHPETGQKMDESFERRRAQAWALDYERQQGQILCENRIKDFREREESPTRETWLAFQDAQKSFEHQEENRRNFEPELFNASENGENINASEWKVLKELQKRERLEFFADGKSDFREVRRSVYSEVREEFRPRWAEYYAAQKNGLDDEPLKEMKAALLTEQKSTLEARRDEACEALREARDGRYRELLDAQAEMRHALHGRQDAGLSSINLLDRFASGDACQTNDLMQAFRDAARETTTNPDDRGPITEEREEVTVGHEQPGSGMRPASSVGLGVTMGLGFGLASFFDALADGLIASKPAPKPRKVQQDMPRPNLFDHAAEEARKYAPLDKEREDRRNYEEQLARTRD